MAGRCDVEEDVSGVGREEVGEAWRVGGGCRGGEGGCLVWLIVI